MAAEKGKIEFRCMRCGHTWESDDDPKQERTCPKCKSNSVRKVRK
jgi:DNA-directed RNA polymerase subunit RPC12/RpoP